METFTLPGDRNAFSYVMEKHQKNGTANGRILFYLADNFRYPTEFDSLLYTSQILQAEAIKYGVEHWRRNRGRCMGAIYWQLNDCWPVASWSSIDSLGRWKALHYYAKRFFAPVLLSACETGAKVELHVSNETMTDLTGTVKWSLRDNSSRVIEEGTAFAEVKSLSSNMAVSLDFSDSLSDKADLRKVYLEYGMEMDGAIVSEGTVLFCRPKHFEFVDPELQADIEETDERFILAINSKAYARYIELDLEGADCIFSDNYFDLSAGGHKCVEVLKNSISGNDDSRSFKDMLKIRSIFDIA